MDEQVNFWNNLLALRDAISTIDPNSDDAVEQVLTYLETIDEVFGRNFDPADEFEAYVTVAFCQTLKAAFARVQKTSSR